MKNKIFKWVKGRQNTGYSILTLLFVTKKWFPIPFDAYIIKYPTGSYIPPHKDEPGFGRHYRVNIILTKPKGGEFIAENTLLHLGRVVIFRPDLVTHEVTPVESGTRYVLSIGCILP